MNATDESLGAGNETPVDLAAVQADDALLDMLGGTVVITDDELSRVLYAWRRDVDAEPIGELVDTDTALVAIDAAKSRARSLLAAVDRFVSRHYLPIAVAAALVLVVCALWLMALHGLLYPLDGE